MWLSPDIQASERTGARPEIDAAALLPAPPRNRHHGRAIMRQMLIAAAIAAGLVALWAALLPVVA